MADPVRLAKRLAEIVPCSRREAELYLAGGWVRVDGQVVEEPQFMVTEQKVELHPDATLTPIAPATILLNQFAEAPQPPRPETRTADDHTGIHLLKQHFVRLTQYLPLQAGASGLEVYTQDWKAARKLTDDAATLEQEYVVEVSGELVEDGLKLLNHGLNLNGRALPPAKVSWQNETRLRFALKGPQPNQIKQMCQRVGLQVVAMKRIRIGRMAMSRMPLGEWRYLAGYERF
ncbi:MAG: rRNA pseudouridine synthase [Nitrosomonadales bacterium]|nr:rRNA pseudouridine synthase [Nitrosomonadales bacterium]